MKIVDISALIPGPFTSFLLKKKLNAQVLKFEDLNNPDQLKFLKPTKDGIGIVYKTINEGKIINAVNFRENALDIIKDELRDAQIFIHNYKPQKIYKIGLAFEDVVKINPDILYVSITGFPSNSLMKDKSAHDLNILALSGYLKQQKVYSAQPNFVPALLLADIFTSYNATLAIMAAMLREEKGEKLEITMLESFCEANLMLNLPQLETKQLIRSTDYIMSGMYPCYTLYNSSDGQEVAVAALEKPLWTDFCHHIEREDLLEGQYDPQAKEEVQKEMKKYDNNHWLDQNLDFCVTPVISINEAKEKGII